MAQRGQASPHVRAAVAKANQTPEERMAELETLGDAMGQEYRELEDAEIARREAAEVDAGSADAEETETAEQQSAAAEAPPATPEAPATPAAAPGEEAQASVSTEAAAGGDPANNS